MVVLEERNDGVILPLRARAGAQMDRLWCGPEGILRVSVTCPPERGKANQAIVALLSRRLRLKKSQIELLSGKTSGQKRFLIRKTTVRDLRARIESAVST